MNISNTENNKTEAANLEQISPVNPVDLSVSSLSCNLDLIPSASYFINKNQTKQVDTELLNRIDSYIRKLEEVDKNKCIKKLRIMNQEDQQQQQQQQEQQEQQQQQSAPEDGEIYDETQNQEETTDEKIKKGRSLLRKSNRNKLIKQLTQDSEKAGSDGNDSAHDEDNSDETKKNTLANRKLLSAKYTHLFFFKADCALSSLSKQIVKSFNSYEFDPPDLNQPATTTTTEDEERPKSFDKSGIIKF